VEPNHTGVVMVHRTKRSGLRMAAMMDHVWDGPDDVLVTTDGHPDTARVTLSTALGVGERLRVVKLVGYGWASQRSRDAGRSQVEAAVPGARHPGFAGLAAEQRRYLDAFWDRADVVIDGDDRLQQAVRFALFHVLQAGARGERRAIPAKGLTG